VGTFGNDSLKYLALRGLFHWHEPLSVRIQRYFAVRVPQ